MTRTFEEYEAIAEEVRKLWTPDPRPNCSKPLCTWTLNDPAGPMPNTWDGGCGICWYLEDGDLKGNEVNYCPKCGGKVIENKAEGSAE